MADSDLSSRERILASAKRLMAEHGYERTSTAAIAREAGSSESQLIRYFGGKVGLLQAIFDESWTPLNDFLQDLVKSTADPYAALVEILKFLFDALERDTELARLFLLEGRRLRGPGEDVLLSQGFLDFADQIRALIIRGQLQGSLDPEVDAAAVLSALIGAAEGMIRDRLIFTGPEGRPPFAAKDVRAVFRSLLSGLRPS